MLLRGVYALMIACHRQNKNAASCQMHYVCLWRLRHVRAGGNKLPTKHKLQMKMNVNVVFEACINW